MYFLLGYSLLQVPFCYYAILLIIIYVYIVSQSSLWNTFFYQYYLQVVIYTLS